jgi:hypothetical protein
MSTTFNSISANGSLTSCCLLTPLSSLNDIIDCNYPKNVSATIPPSPYVFSIWDLLGDTLNDFNIYNLSASTVISASPFFSSSIDFPIDEVFIMSYSPV